MNESQELIERPREIRAVGKPYDFPSAPMPSANASYGVENIEGEGGVHLREYWNAVRKRLWLVIGITLLVTMLAAIYMARRPDIYQAQTRVQVDKEDSVSAGGGNSAKSSPIILSTASSDPTYFNTQLQILTGPSLLRRVAKSLDLEHNPAFLRPQSVQTRSTWQSLLNMVGIRTKEAEKAKKTVATTAAVPLTSSFVPASSRDDLEEAKRFAPYVAALQAGLQIEPVKETRTSNYNKDTRLIDISFKHSDPQMAARIVNAMADAFVISNREKRNQNNDTTGDFLQKRVAELQSQIRSGEERLGDYAKRNQILSLDDKQNTVVDRLTGLNKQLLEAEDDRKKAESEYRAVLAPGAVNALAERDTKSIADVDLKLGDLRQKRAQLLVDATEEAPEVKEISQQIIALEKQTAEVRSRASSTILTNLQTRYRQALAREQALRSSFDQQKGATMTQNDAAINYRIIQQEIDTNKTLLDGLLQRSKENDVILAGTPNNISVVDYALLPEVPIGPERLRSVILASLFALVAGIGLALFLDYLDDAVHSTEDIEKLLNLPALAVIPSVSSMPKRRLLAAANGIKPRGLNGGGGSQLELLMNTDLRSPLAEAYRQLRTSVLLSTAGHPPKTLLVTSSVPGEGKTTTAVNTALSLAQTGASVLLIDADMRRPRLHSIFDIENNRGLSTILSSEMNEAEMLSILTQDETSNLHLLPSGPIPPNPAELLGSAQMRQLLGVLESTFTHVVVDSPPIGSFTDGVLIASMVNGVLLVVHGGKSSRHVVRRSRQLLYEVGAKVLGVVLNNVNLRSHDYYYYQRYYQQSYYNTDAENLASGTKG